MKSSVALKAAVLSFALVSSILSVPAQAHEARYHDSVVNIVRTRLGTRNACSFQEAGVGWADASASDPFHYDENGEQVLLFNSTGVVKYGSFGGTQKCASDVNYNGVLMPAHALGDRGVNSVIWDWEDGAEKPCTTQPSEAGDDNSEPAAAYGWLFLWAAPPCGWTVDPADQTGGEYQDTVIYAEFRIVYGSGVYEGRANDEQHLYWMLGQGDVPDEPVTVARKQRRFFRDSFTPHPQIPCPPDCSPLGPPDRPVNTVALLGARPQFLIPEGLWLPEPFDCRWSDSPDNPEPGDNETVCF